MGTRQNMSDGQGCVYWSEGIGFEYISCCDEHKALIEKTLHALSIEDKASRTYVKKAHEEGMQVWGVLDNFQNDDLFVYTKFLNTLEGRQKVIKLAFTPR